MTQITFHSSQEALAIAVRDWLLNSGQLVKSDMMRIANLIELVRPLQKKNDKLMEEINKNFKAHGKEFNPLFDKEGYLSLFELNYEIFLSELFGKLWRIITDEELIPQMIQSHFQVLQP